MEDRTKYMRSRVGLEVFPKFFPIEVVTRLVITCFLAVVVVVVVVVLVIVAGTTLANPYLANTLYGGEELRSSLMFPNHALSSRQSVETWNPEVYLIDCHADLSSRWFDTCNDRWELDLIWWSHPCPQTFSTMLLILFGRYRLCLLDGFSSTMSCSEG